jgi:16S rRNA G966 N2-methylase RsmD
MKKDKKQVIKYENVCFINKPFKIIPFIPENTNRYLNLKNFEYKVKYIFPIMKNIKSSDDFSKLKMSKIGLYSIAYIELGKKMLEIIKDKFKNTSKLILTDTNGGVGGLSLHLIDHFKKTNIIEINKFHYDIIEHNLKTYGFAKSKYKLYNKDSLEYVYRLKSNIIIFDPPWYGKDYLNKSTLSLGINNVNIACIINKLLLKKDIQLILILIPENFNFKKFISLINFKIIEIHTVYIKKNKKQAIISIQI